MGGCERRAKFGRILGHLDMVLGLILSKVSSLAAASLKPMRICIRFGRPAGGALASRPAGLPQTSGMGCFAEVEALRD